MTTHARRHNKERFLSAVICAAALLIGPSRPTSAGDAEPLPSYNVDLRETTVSGVSSGAYMAVQFGVAQSAIVKGVGATAGGRMEWAVYAPTSRKVGALAGRYGGVSGEATVGVGAGVNVLVGGSNRTVSLQPVSVEGQTGLNVAGGVTELELRPAR